MESSISEGAQAPAILPSDFINNQSINMAVTQTIESGVLAGPVTVPATITITGTLVIV